MNGQPQTNKTNLHETALPMNEHDSISVDGDQHLSSVKVRNLNKQRTLLGFLALFLLFASILWESTTSSSAAAEDPGLKANGIVSGVTAGTALFISDDQSTLEPRDYNITMNEGIRTSRMLIWDFAAEDGDVVEIKVNGVTVGTPAVIMNKPLAIDVPVPSTVEIIGVKDGGGGITYGVKFPGNIANNAYFNVAPENSANTYTISGQ